MAAEGGSPGSRSLLAEVAAAGGTRCCGETESISPHACSHQDIGRRAADDWGVDALWPHAGLTYVQQPDESRW